MSSQNTYDVRSQKLDAEGKPVFKSASRDYSINGVKHTESFQIPDIAKTASRVQIDVEEIKPKVSLNDVIEKTNKLLSDIETSKLLSGLPELTKTLTKLKDYNDTALKSAKIDKEVGKIALAYSNTAHDGTAQNIAGTPVVDSKGPSKS